MQLTLNRLTFPWLHPKYFDMHLLDDNCGPFHVNFTHIIVKTTYGECKTVRTNSADGVIYRNILMALVRVQPEKVITRVPDVLLPFQCRFDRKKITSISSKMSGPKGNEPVKLVMNHCRGSLSGQTLFKSWFQRVFTHCFETLHKRNLFLSTIKSLLSDVWKAILPYLSSEVAQHCHTILQRMDLFFSNLKFVKEPVL